MHCTYKETFRFNGNGFSVAPSSYYSHQSTKLAKIEEGLVVVGGTSSSSYGVELYTNSYGWKDERQIKNDDVVLVISDVLHKHIKIYHLWFT